MSYVFTDINVTVEHLSPDSSNANQEGFVNDISLNGLAVNIQPTSPEVSALYGGAYGKVFTMYTTTSGILETDRVTVSGTNDQFIVKGKQFFGYGVGIHGEYILEKTLV